MLASLLPTTDRKRIDEIENIINDTKKSPLLNRQRSSSESPVSSNKELCGREKEIDESHRSIEREVFGRDKDRDLISQMLHEELDACGPSSSAVKNYSVIGIHGIAGSGKSTLAQYVCDYEKNKGKYFDLVMFIHVPKTFMVDDTFRDMLEQMTPDQSSNAEGQYNKDLRSLHKKLNEKLKGRRFLLVLDDVWVSDKNQREWDILLDSLNAGQSGSRVLVTAQTKGAAANLGAQKQISIPDLEEVEYLKLFMHHALQGADDVDGQYKRIARNIVKKLHSSPIAAVTVARRLGTDKNLVFWETTSNLDVLNKTMDTLWWSYDHLGPDTRRCFEYLSTFPRGYKLKRDELVRMWMAQGFITASNATVDMEDLGHLYFEELLTFSFLQVQRAGAVAEHFTIHDLLHELAERVAGTSFFRTDMNGWPKDIPLEVRHLFIETNNRAEITEKILEFGNLRTIIIMEKYNANVDSHFLKGMFTRLRKLRVLIVKLQCNSKILFSVPESIGQMKHLHYLSFRSNYNHLELNFPSTIRKLYHMQTLDIRDFKTSCAEDMANLIHLRHCTSFVNFPNVGKLTSLQTMRIFEVKREQGHELKQLMDLNKLRGSLTIRGLGDVTSKEEALQARLPSKKRLKSLALDFSCLQHPQPSNVQEEVLEGLCPPENLEELTIVDYDGSRYPSWMLSRQHPDAPKQLHTLHFSSCKYPLLSIPDQDTEFFSHLRSLRLYNCKWEHLPHNIERIMSLKNLYINYCDRIKNLPTLPKSLGLINIFRCYWLSETLENKKHQNWEKIQHVPKKSFDRPL